MIFGRALERGTWIEVRWLFSRYGEWRVAEWVRKHALQPLSKRSFALRRSVLGLY